MSGRPKNALEARPFLKWAGGKAQLVEALLQRVPERFGVYHEPFVGAGALFFALAARGRIKKARLADVNPELMNVWTSLRDEPENVITELVALEPRVTEKDFYEIRGWNPGDLTSAQRAARLIYLNKTCFNGLYRENRSGRFNVPFGRYASPKVLDRPNLMLVARALKSVVLETASFGSVLKHAQAGDFVYFDPPYHPTSRSASFTAYSKGGFGASGQEQLATVVAALVENGVHVLLSNSDVPFIRKLYEGRGYTVETVAAKRAINSKGDRRGEVAEVLVSAAGVSPKRRASARSAARQLPIDF